MADENRWNDVKDEVQSFGERIGSTDKDTDQSNTNEDQEALHRDLVDGDNADLQEEFANEPGEEAGVNRPQFGERIDQDDRLMADEHDRDNDYDAKAM